METAEGNGMGIRNNQFMEKKRRVPICRGTEPNQYNPAKKTDRGKQTQRKREMSTNPSDSQSKGPERWGPKGGFAKGGSKGTAQISNRTSK